MTELALDLLVADRVAEVIVVVSKPPAPAVAERLLSRLGKLIAADGTPVVACLLGLDDADEPVAVRGTLEGAAIEAARLCRGHAGACGRRADGRGPDRPAGCSGWTPGGRSPGRPRCCSAGRVCGPR